MKIANKDKFSVRVTKNYPDLINDLEEHSKTLNISFNKLIILILSNYLNKYKNDRLK